jgi:hypothetical protein
VVASAAVRWVCVWCGPRDCGSGLNCPGALGWRLVRAARLREETQLPLSAGLALPIR